MMNKLIYTLALGLLIASCQNKKNEQGGHEHHQPEAATSTASQSDNSKKSIPQEAHGNVGDAHVSVYYHSPAVRDRVIWGGLVPYGEVWVAGAHSATSVEFSKAIKIEGTTIPKGKYAFFTIPGQESWTLILNKNWEQHLADDYDQAEDVIRIQEKEAARPLAPANKASTGVMQQREARKAPNKVAPIHFPFDIDLASCMLFNFISNF